MSGIRDGTVKITTTLTVRAMLTSKKKYSGEQEINRGGGIKNRGGGGAKKNWGGGNAPYAPPLATRLTSCS